MAEADKNQYRPDEVSPPGASLAETIEALGMSQAELAARMGRPKKTINEIIKGKASITADTALQLEKVLGVPASFWTNRERIYREALARSADESSLERHRDWARAFPLAAMAKLGWIRRCSNWVERVRELLRFFAIASPDQLQVSYAEVRLRKGNRACREALLAWLRRGEIQAKDVECAPFCSDAFEALLNRARSWTLLRPEIFQQQMTHECAKVGVAVVFVRELPRCAAHGATRWLSPTKAMLQLSLRYKTNDQLWFTFFHEAEHILRHRRTKGFVECDGAALDREEIEANESAGARLIPPGDLQQFVSNCRHAVSGERVAAFADKIGIAPGIVVGRLQHDKVIPYRNLNQLKVRLAWKASQP
jgi:HTH-type transcriptional regulator / antitoxin HigA